MTMEFLLSAIRREVDRAVNKRKHKRYGKIDSYNKEKHSYKVKWMPGEQISGWIPIGSDWAGNGYGDFSPMKPGTMVEASHEAGDIESTFTASGFWNEEDKPLEVEAGENLRNHEQGQHMHFKNDGSFVLGGAGTAPKPKSESDSSQGGQGGSAGQSEDKRPQAMQKLTFDKDGNWKNEAPKGKYGVEAKQDVTIKSTDGKIYIG